MVDPSRSVNLRRQVGFTLVEVMLAMAILVFAATTLISGMFAAASEHRGSDMRLRASNMVETVLHDVLEQHLIENADLAQQLPGKVGADLPGYQGLRYAVAFIENPEDPTLVQARIRVAWKEQGQDTGADFEAILVRQVPFSIRVHKARQQRR